MAGWENSSLFRRGVQFFSLSLGYSLVSFRPDNRVGRDTSGEAETCVLFREYVEFCARSN